MINLDLWCPSVHMIKAGLKVSQAETVHVCFHAPTSPQERWLLYAGLWDV